MYKGPGIGGTVGIINIKGLLMTGVLWAREMDKSMVLQNIEIKLHILILSLKWYKHLSMDFLRYSMPSSATKYGKPIGRDCK